MEDVILLREKVIKVKDVPVETLGGIFYKDKRLVETMELPWLNNQHNISCIPPGTYICIMEPTSPGHKYPHFRILDVLGRKGILMHKITYVKDLRGCVGVGLISKDLNGDLVPDIAKSTIALELLVNTLPAKFNLIIKDK